MVWNLPEEEQHGGGTPFHFDLFSIIANHKDYYKILEVEYDASQDTIRSNYIRLALKWHPDKRKGEESATTRFQDIVEAYKVLSDPVKRREYDSNGLLCVGDNNLNEYLNNFKSLILTCNGLGWTAWKGRNLPSLDSFFSGVKSVRRILQELALFVSDL